MWLAWSAAICSLLVPFDAQPAKAYITVPLPTLGMLCSSTYITQFRIEEVNKDRGLIVYRKVRDIKGSSFVKRQIMGRSIGLYMPT